MEDRINRLLSHSIAPPGAVDFLYLRQDQLSPSEAWVSGSQRDGWLEDYRQQRGYLRDRVVLAAQQRSAPFNWQDCARPNAGLCAPAGRCQRVKGFTFMVHDAQRQMSMLSIIRRQPMPDFAQAVTSRLADLQMLLIALHDQTAGLLARDIPALSPREREVLLWGSRGKTYDEIAMILGIRLSTVKFHIANATRKLGASNGKHAIRRALEINLLPAPLY